MNNLFNIDLQAFHPGIEDWWIKLIEMLQNNWAVIVPNPKHGADIIFVSDGSGIFDRISYGSKEEAEAALLRNGFSRYYGEADIMKFIPYPRKPYTFWSHPNGRIYCTEKYWC